MRRTFVEQDGVHEHQTKKRRIIVKVVAGREPSGNEERNLSGAEWSVLT